MAPRRSIPSNPTASASTTWQATPGSGATTGSVPAITRALQETIHAAPPKVPTASSAEARTSATTLTASATGSLLAVATRRTAPQGTQAFGSLAIKITTAAPVSAKCDAQRIASNGSLVQDREEARHLVPREDVDAVLATGLGKPRWHDRDGR